MDILECKVKWALARVTWNKASGGDRIPDELFQILKDNAVKVLHLIGQKTWKNAENLEKTGKDLFFIPIPKKSNAKE